MGHRHKTVLLPLFPIQGLALGLYRTRLVVRQTPPPVFFGVVVNIASHWLCPCPFTVYIKVMSETDKMDLAGLRKSLFYGEFMPSLSR